MIKITLENDTYLEIPYDTFTQFIKWSAASEFLNTENKIIWILNFENLPY